MVKQQQWKQGVQRKKHIGRVQLGDLFIVVVVACGEQENGAAGHDVAGRWAAQEARAGEREWAGFGGENQENDAAPGLVGHGGGWAEASGKGEGGEAVAVEGLLLRRNSRR